MSGIDNQRYRSGSLQERVVAVERRTLEAILAEPSFSRFAEDMAPSFCSRLTGRASARSFLMRLGMTRTTVTNDISSLLCAALR